MRIPLAALSVLAFLLCFSPAHAEEKTDVLIIDGFSNHDWQLTTRWVRHIIEPADLFDVTVSTSPETKDALGWDEWRPDFSAHDVVIINCNSLGGRPDWPEAVKRDFERFVEEGGGVFILHSANNSFAEWPAYNRIIGMGWRPADAGYAVTVNEDGTLTRIPPGEGKGTYHGPRVDAVVHRLGEHPIQSGYPRAWMTPNLEVYKYPRGPAEDIEVLSYAYDAETGKNWPIEWTVRYGKGRVYNGSLGHVWRGDEDPPGIRCVAFQTTLIRALQWLAGREVTWPVPENFPTEENIRLAPPMP